MRTLLLAVLRLSFVHTGNVLLDVIGSEGDPRPAQSNAYRPLPPTGTARYYTPVLIC